MPLITCKGSKKKLQNSHLCLLQNETVRFPVSQSQKVDLIHYTHEGAFSMCSQSSFNVGVTDLKITTYSKTKGHPPPNKN